MIGLDEEHYQWAVVGNDDRQSLWFLCRTPSVDAAVLDRMKAIALERGYNLSPLIKVPQKER